MTKRVAELPLATEPGAAFQYSSIGYAILGLVIERISGNTLDVYFRERIFEPLQMTSTGFQVQRDQTSRLTTNYDVTPTGLMVTDAAESSAWLMRPTLLDGGGGVISTARDFARFSTMQLNDGTLDGTQVLRPDTARRARSNMLPQASPQRSEVRAARLARPRLRCRDGCRLDRAGQAVSCGRHCEPWRCGGDALDRRSDSSRNDGVHGAVHCHHREAPPPISQRQ